MLLINITNNLTNSYPLWYFLNDFLIINLNIIGIFTVIIFISTVIRLEYPSYTISNLIACKTCLAIGFMSLSILLNNVYALASDFRGIGYIDSFCIVRGTISSILFITMYTSLCFKAFNRLRCIVYRIRSVTQSYKSLLILTLIQWIFVAILILPILLTNGVEYDWGSHICLVTLNKTWQFLYLSMFYIYRKITLFLNFCLFSEYLLYFSNIYLKCISLYSLLCCSFIIIRTISSKTSICSSSSNRYITCNAYFTGNILFNFNSFLDDF